MIRQLLDPACAELGIGDISTVRDFTFVADTAAAFLAIGSAPGIVFGEAYNAGSGEAVTIAEFIEIAAELTGCSKPLRHDAGRMRPDNSEVRALLADSSRLAAATGWRPRTNLRDGLAQTIAWWRDRLGRGQVRGASGFMA